MRWKFFLGTILVGLAATGCDVVPDARAPLSPPLESAHDPSVVGVWFSEKNDASTYLHIGERDDGLLDALLIFAATDPGEATGGEDPIFWFRAVVHASVIDGVTYYNARRYKGMGNDYTAPGEEPGYMIIRAELRGGDTLVLRFMSGDRIKKLAEEGRIAVRVLSSQLFGDNFEYRLLDVSPEELRELVREDPPAKLFGEELEFQRLARPKPAKTEE